MKVLLISLYPPTRHNIGGPSSLPFYLAKYRPDTIEIDLFYYEGYEDRESVFMNDLQSIFQNITRIRHTPKWKYYPLRFLQEFSLVPAFRGLSLKHLPCSPDLMKAINGNYDLIWIYTGLLFPWAKALQQYRLVMTGPDNLLLHHQLVQEIYVKQGRQIPGNLSLRTVKKHYDFALFREHRWASSTALLHVVGEDDKRTFDQLGAASHSFFSPHPYYEFVPLSKPIDQTVGKLTILVAGVNSSVYTGNYFDEVVKLLQDNKDLIEYFRFMVIGKGFEGSVASLTRSGFEVEYQHWVISYEETIAACHIQFFPIIQGTGTKGKVLCALATGLLAIGSRYAFENIQFDPRENAILLENGDVPGAIEAFRSIIGHKKLFSEKAQMAATIIRNQHAPKLTAELFWKKVVSFWNLQ